MKAPIQEDTVIAWFCCWLEGKHFKVLAQGANQGARFRFVAPHGRFKAPDAVLAKSGVLLVVEAKVRPSNLFKSHTAVRESDAAVMVWLKKSSVAQARLIEECRRNITVSDMVGIAPPKAVLSAVVSGPGLAKFEQELKALGLSGFYVDSISHTFRVAHIEKDLRLLLA